MSATTWPDPAVESVATWQPVWPVVQLPLEDDPPDGGPRAPAPPVVVRGSPPVAELAAVPEHSPDEPAQSRAADAADQLDAPAMVGAPVLAPEPGAPAGAGGVAGWSGVCSFCTSAGAPPLAPSSAVVSLVVVAFDVDAARMIGLMLLASGPLEAPEFVTAWHVPPETPSHEPVPVEPRGSGEVDGSVAVAELVTFPSQTLWPSQLSTAPAADAADGPAGCRAVLTVCASPA